MSAIKLLFFTTLHRDAFGDHLNLFYLFQKFELNFSDLYKNTMDRLLDLNRLIHFKLFIVCKPHLEKPSKTSQVRVHLRKILDCLMV